MKLKDMTKEQILSVIEKHRDINVDNDVWCKYIFEQYIDILNSFGFEDVKIFFSGFYSQGDGASFTSSININKFLDYLIINNYDNRQWRVLKKWYDKEIIDFSLSIYRNNNKYFHKKSCNTSIDEIWYFDNNNKTKSYFDPIFDELEEIVDDIRNILSIDIYEQLKKEYEYLSSDKIVEKTILINDYNFNKNGDII